MPDRAACVNCCAAEPPQNHAEGLMPAITCCAASSSHLDGVELLRVVQIAALAGLAAATYALHLEVQQILLLTFGAITFSVADQVQLARTAPQPERQEL